MPTGSSSNGYHHTKTIQRIHHKTPQNQLLLGKSKRGRQYRTLRVLAQESEQAGGLHLFQVGGPHLLSLAQPTREVKNGKGTPNMVAEILLPQKRLLFYTTSNIQRAWISDLATCLSYVNEKLPEFSRTRDELSLDPLKNIIIKLDMRSVS